MESLAQDLRFAVRSLVKTPSFTVIAALCLALGIATNTTLFSIFDAIVIRPLPFDQPDRLVSLLRSDPKTTRGGAGTSYLNYKDWKDQSRSFSQMAAQSGRQVAITEGEEPERLSAQLISASLFPMLGIHPQFGRLFREDDDALGAPGVVLLSDGLWRRRYAADPAIVGRVISIDNAAYTVVGVMPPRFMYPQRSEIWMPIAPVLGSNRTSQSLRVVARLKDGISLAQANQEFSAVAGRVDQVQGTTLEGLVGIARSFEAEFVDGDVRSIVTTMYGAVTFVLLIACANIANLLLTRAAGRQREIAVRAAIGAGRGRIIRQLITEAVVLGTLAGALAIPLTWIGLKLIDRAIPPEDPQPYWMQWSLDGTTLVYTAVVAIAAGIVFGLAPALHAMRGDVFASLKDRGRGATVTKSRLRGTLVVLEVALALVLLVGAMLFTRSFAGLRAKQAGFNTAPLLTAQLYLPGSQYDSTTARVQRARDIIQRVEQVPGVDAATISQLLPLDGGTNGGRAVVEGANAERGKEPEFGWAGVAGRWFATIGNALSSGRTFTPGELESGAPLAVINQSMAKTLWPRGNAVGGRFKMAGDLSQPWLTVIGVAKDIRVESLDNTGPLRMMAYLPYQFSTPRGNVLIVRVHGEPLSLASTVRDAVRASDPKIPVYRIQTMEKVRELSYWQYGLFGWMFGIFGVIALFLAAIGVYGVISYGVSQRTHEIGVRVALGAQRRDVTRLVVRQGMTLAGIGILVGLLGALGVTRFVRSFLVDVSPTDPISFIGVALFLAGVALVASLVPARRAMGVDPIVALRQE